MRSSPASFSGRQCHVLPSRVSYRPQRMLSYLRHPASYRDHKHSTVLLGSERRRTRHASCTVSSGDIELESGSKLSKEQLSGDGKVTTQRKDLLHTAALLSFVAVLSALAVPAPADAAEAFPLEFLSTFLVTYFTLLLMLFCIARAPAQGKLVSKSRVRTHMQDQMQQLGPWGPAAFIAAVVCFEMIPLFPTQPLALSSGLLFGAQEVGKHARPRIALQSCMFKMTHNHQWLSMSHVFHMLFEYSPCCRELCAPFSQQHWRHQ